MFHDRLGAIVRGYSVYITCAVDVFVNHVVASSLERVTADGEGVIQLPVLLSRFHREGCRGGSVGSYRFTGFFVHQFADENVVTRQQVRPGYFVHDSGGGSGVNLVSLLALTVHTLGAVGILSGGRHGGLFRCRVGVGRSEDHVYFGQLFSRHLERGRVIRSDQTDLFGICAEGYLGGGNARYLGSFAILGQGAVSSLDVGQRDLGSGSNPVGLLLSRVGALQSEGELLGGGNL